MTNYISFSVIIPLYNKEKEIARAIESVLAQSYDVFELIIIDNNSKDGSMSLVKDFNDPRIRILTEPNQGVSYARNAGIISSTGTYIAFLDADDYWHEYHLFNLSQLIRKFPDAGIWSNSYQICHVNHKLMERAIVGSTVDDNIFSDKHLFTAFVKGDMPFFTSSIAISQQILLKFGLFDTDLTYGEDVFLWSRIIAEKQVVIGTYIGAIYHRNANQRSNSSNILLSELPLIEKFENWFNNTSHLLSFEKEFRIFIATQLFISVMANIKNNNIIQARRIFNDKRMKLLRPYRRKVGAAIILNLPIPFGYWFSLILKKVNLLH
jgi:glycosyltransferase involved in cell wall biosynthesis